MSENQAPFSEEAERAFLGAVMYDYTAATTGLEGVRIEVEDFYVPAHATIWEAVDALLMEQRPVDALTVEDKLKATKKLDRVGGSTALDALIDACTTVTHAHYYLNIIQKKAKARKILHSCLEARHDICTNPDKDPDDILNKILEELFDCSGATESSITLGEAANVLIRRFKDAKEGIKPGLPCFLRDLEDYLGFWKNAGLYFIASEPALGKTTFLQQQLKHWAKDCGIPVAGISLEMRLEDFFGRMLCEEADVSMFNLEQGTPEPPGASPPSRIQKFGKACQAWIGEDGKPKYPLYLTDKRMNVVEICTWVRMMVKRFGVKGVGIDYLQLMKVPTGRRFGSDAERMEYVVEMMRDLSKEINIPIIIMAQITKEARQSAKGAGGNKKRRPMPSDIRGSSAIEDVAWGIIMMYKWINEDTDQEQIIVDLCKHRSGTIGRSELIFQKTRQRMSSRALYSPRGY
ncbi:hypothetical protein D4R42_01455 [bacterium]|nr:MAG: hypothetical protein D4R42_01455 [bacterium]